jgi:hypothetical protein
VPANAISRDVDELHIEGGLEGWRELDSRVSHPGPGFSARAGALEGSIYDGPIAGVDRNKFVCSTLYIEGLLESLGENPGGGHQQDYK